MPTPPWTVCGLLVRGLIMAPRANRGLEPHLETQRPTGSRRSLGKTAVGTTALKASQTFFYYRAGLKDPADVQPYPALDTNGDGQVDDGLKIVTEQGKNVQWRCLNGTWSPTPPTQCSNGKLVLRIFFPDCLQEDANGPLLDSADHRSHMVDAGSAGCPSNYIPVPRLQTNFQFPMPTTRGKVKLSSDHPGAPPGSTMHADFFNAWQEGTLEDLVARCINGGPFTARNPKPQDCL